MPQWAIKRYKLSGEGFVRVMLSLQDEIFEGLQQLRTIAHQQQVLDLFPKVLQNLQVLLEQTKLRTLPDIKSTASQSINRDIFSDESSEFIDSDEGVSFDLCWTCWKSQGRFHQPARDRFVMNHKNSADGSNPHPLQIEQTGLLVGAGSLRLASE